MELRGAKGVTSVVVCGLLLNSGYAVVVSACVQLVYIGRFEAGCFVQLRET
jgi:hypothetical protein